MTRRRVLVLAAAALLAAGCGSANHTPTTGTTAGGSFRALVSAAYEHARCMRSHGVPDYPDPRVINQPGRQGIGIVAPASMAGSPAFRAAERACKGVLPDPGNKNSAQQAAQQRAHAQVVLAFARCLRTHGEPDFPDPSASGQLTLTTVRAAGVDLQAPSFLTAARACVGVTHGEITLAQVRQAIAGGH